jgi:ABC-type Fe3+ transport system substrate-binding protein
VVSSLGLDRTRALAQAFADQTGIIVQLEELPAEPLSLRLQFLSNQPADIWLGGTAEEYYQADKQRYLQSYQAAAALALAGGI